MKKQNKEYLDDKTGYVRSLVNVMRIISPSLARRLAIVRQCLAGPRPSADCKGIMDVMRNLGYVQIDPMRIVEKSHLLVLWSRLGQYDPAHLDTLLWKERRLFEDWAQATSIVLTEDYPIFKAMKRGFAADNQPWAERIRNWTKKNKKLRQYILREIHRKGPLSSLDFEDKSVESWHSTGWSAGRNIDIMLHFLWAKGEIMIAGRVGGRKLWNLTEHCLPNWTPQEQLSDGEAVWRAVQKSLRALGVASPQHIRQHYIRGSYSDLESVLAKLEENDRIIRVEIREGKRAWRDPWYVHSDDQSLLDRLASKAWDPHTTLLSPFDNLICNRRRTEQLFDFDFRLEVYTPKSKRRYGCYVMPILHGDRFIGRVDPVMDRKQERLKINAVYAESNAPKTKEAAQAVVCTIEELGGFLGAKEILYGRNVPTPWKHIFR